MSLLKVLEPERLADQGGDLLEVDEDVGQNIDLVALLHDHVPRLRALHISKDVRRLHDLLNGCVSHGIRWFAAEGIHERRSLTHSACQRLMIFTRPRETPQDGRPYCSRLATTGPKTPEVFTF
jgi:hypothetical protein